MSVFNPGVVGSTLGQTGNVAVWSDTNSIGRSSIFDDGVNVTSSNTFLTVSNTLETILISAAGSVEIGDTNSSTKVVVDSANAQVNVGDASTYVSVQPGNALVVSHGNLEVQNATGNVFLNVVQSLVTGTNVGIGDVNSTLHGTQINIADLSKSIQLVSSGQISIGNNAGQVEIITDDTTGQVSITAGAVGINDSSFPHMLSVGGNIAVTSAGSGFMVAQGANAKMGATALIAGTKVIATTAVTASSRIFLTENADGGVPGTGVRVSARTAGASFTITSINAADTSVVAWIIFEPS